MAIRQLLLRLPMATKNNCRFGLLSLCILLSSMIGSCVSKDINNAWCDYDIEKLLINVTDMPSGWKILEGPKYIPDVTVVSAIGIGFFAEKSAPRDKAFHLVYKYNTDADMEWIFEYKYGWSGKTPDNWVYKSDKADEMYMTCYNWEGREPFSCEYGARYNNIITTFQTWMIPGYMSVNDIERIARIIDERIVICDR